jgi:hypothetical protein
MSGSSARERVWWVICFSVAMAVVEAAIVVYLRRIYYPEGFHFPLKAVELATLSIELVREVATVVMLVAVGMLAGTRGWERFAYFLVAFGAWDIAYYLWLKLFINWPASLLDWDILFLLPLPWIGPVIAPCSIAVIMIVIGMSIITLLHRGFNFRATPLSWVLAICATAILLFSFMHDFPATLHFQEPHPYLYGLLVIGDLLYIIAYLHAARALRKSP